MTAWSSLLLPPLRVSPSDPLRELFESCKSGDVVKVRELVSAQNVNARDTTGRRSSPLHFAAGTLNRVLIHHAGFRKSGVRLRKTWACLRLLQWQLSRK